MTALGLLALIGFAGLTIDFGLAMIGCQQCQTVADTGALAGAQELDDPDYAGALARYVSWINVPLPQRTVFTISSSFYPVGDVLPSGNPAPRGGALIIKARKYVKYFFLPVLGFDGVTVARTATATKYLSGTCIAPIWISWTTVPVEGQICDLLMKGPSESNVPGSFGFLTPNGGVDFEDALRGTITIEEEELQRVKENDTVWAYTGVAVAHWLGPLKNDWNSRMERATWDPWASDTCEVFHADNPRILIVPFVEWLDGTGNNARFRIDKFGAFYIESVIANGANSYINGRFIDFMKPGGKVLGINPGQLVE